MEEITSELCKSGVAVEEAAAGRRKQQAVTVVNRVVQDSV